jgi:hypothetical protein
VLVEIVIVKKAKEKMMEKVLKEVVKEVMPKEDMGWRR